jgi:type IV secretion system protein VirB9
MTKRAAFLIILFAQAAVAQIAPHSGAGDPRFQVVEYQPEQIVLIRAAPGYQVTIQLAADEHIESVAVGDSGAWQVSASKVGDHLFVKSIQAGVSTNMTVITSARLYVFDLQSLGAPSPDMPYSVQFRYPASPQTDQVNGPAVEGHYKMSGSRALWPARISDDGKRTLIDWPRDTPIPAVYTLDAQGRESLVNGAMRDGVYVIDSVLPRLVFRIDRQVATASRKKRQTKT